MSDIDLFGSCLREMVSVFQVGQGVTPTVKFFTASRTGVGVNIACRIEK